MRTTRKIYHLYLIVKKFSEATYAPSEKFLQLCKLAWKINIKKHTKQCTKKAKSQVLTIGALRKPIFFQKWRVEKPCNYVVCFSKMGFSEAAYKYIRAINTL